MDVRMVLHVGAILLLAGTVLAFAIEMARLGRESDPATTSVEKNGDPLAVELVRCKALGTEAANDDACKAAWATSRERFLAPDTRYQGSAIEPSPATPDAPVLKGPSKVYLGARSSPSPGMGPEGR